MATFISTVTFTDQGLREIGDTTRRAAALKKSARRAGIEVTGIYWTLGAFDGLLTFNAPDDETATAWLLNLVSLGNLRTTTTRAFNALEMDRILARRRGGEERES